MLFEPVLMSNQEVKSLFAGELKVFSKSNLDTLYKRGILIHKKSQDDTALSNLIKMVEGQVYNKVNLLYIIPTSVCNLACKYCFIGELNHKFPQKMSTATADNMLHKFFAHLKSISAPKATLLFYGGEPTLNYDIMKYVIEKTRKESPIPIDISMVSNGTNLTDEMIAFFKKNEIHIGISIDGPKQVTDKNRIYYQSDRSVYDTVMPNIEKLKKSGISFGLSITVTDETLNNPHFLDWVKNLGVDAVNYNVMQFHDKNADWKTYIPKATKFLFESYDALKNTSTKDNRLMRKIIAFHDECFCYSDCAASGGQQFVIRPNGDVSVCHGYWNTQKEICGNINKDSFNKMFQSPYYKDWKDTLTIKRKKCLKCPAFYICGGGCPLEAEVLFGNKTYLDKPFCMYIKAVLKELLKRELLPVQAEKN